MYQLTLYRVGYRSNDAYSHYLDIKHNNNLTRSQIRELDKLCSGSPEQAITLEISPDGKYLFQTQIKENDVCLIKLNRL